MKQQPATSANDNDTAEDHLVVVTFGTRATLEGLAAPVEMLIEVLSFEAPGDAIALPSPR